MDDDDFRDAHTNLDYDELDVDRIDSGVCLSTPSLCSEVELTFKNLSLGSVAEEDKYELSKVFSNVPTKALFYQNHDGDTLLHLALICNNKDYATYLIKRVEDPKYLNIQNYTFFQSPLHLSTSMRNLTVTSFLLKAGASVCLKDRDGNNPLHIACSMGDFELVELILSVAHQNVNIIEDMNYQGRTCLHLALDSKSEERFKIIEIIACQCRTSLSIREGKCGYTILHELVKAGDFVGVSILISLDVPAHVSKLDVNAPSYDHSTPLDIALQMSFTEIAGALLCKGALTSSIASLSPD